MASPEPPYTNEQLRELELNPDRMPKHVAVIMDGNGRWAQQRGFPRVEGHRRGVTSVRVIVEEAARLGLEQLTLYCFSTENWKRPEKEQNMLMHLLRQFVIEERAEIDRQQLRFTTIGRRDGLGSGVIKEIDKTIDASRDNTGMTLCLALNYGSRQELVDATRQIAAAVARGDLQPDDICEDTIASHLYTAGMPDPDLLIRTAGEMRISNYLLWQISYAEIWVTDNFWPEFREEHLRAALRSFASRDRRFGGLSS